MESLSRAQYAWIALRCQSGEAGAFEDLMAVMERPLFCYALTLTGSEDGALDVLQEVWLRAFRGIRKLKDPGALRPWLYSITHGIAIDGIRRNVAREHAEAAHSDEFEEAEEPSFANADAAAIYEALSRIDAKHREVLALHFLDDLSLTEIAAVIGCSEGTVKSRMHYAKRAMKKNLEGVHHGTRK